MSHGVQISNKIILSISLEFFTTLICTVQFSTIESMGYKVLWNGFWKVVEFHRDISENAQDHACFSNFFQKIALVISLTHNCHESYLDSGFSQIDKIGNNVNIGIRGFTL